MRKARQHRPPPLTTEPSASSLATPSPERPARGNLAIQRCAGDNRTGMPEGLKSNLEQASGLSMDDVRVHYNSSKPAQLQALAYTQGNQIHVGPGQEKHLAHEAWHVVQQKQGRVKANSSVGDQPLNDEPRLENEASRMAEKLT